VTNKETGLDSDTVRSIIQQSQSNRRHPMQNAHKLWDRNSKKDVKKLEKTIFCGKNSYIMQGY
jgi:hypothetical protein